MTRPGGAHGLLLFALVGVGYAIGSKLAYTWFGADGVSASFFPAAGVTLAALVLVRREQWWIVLLAAGLAEFTLNLWHDLGPAASAGYVVPNLVQPVVGALLLAAAVTRLDIGRTRHLALFLVFGVIVAPAVGGALGATTFVLDGGEGWARFAGQWWVGDGLGVLVIGGAILSLRSSSARRVTTRRATEGLLLTAVGLLSAVAVLRLDWFALVYLPIALLVIMAFRVGTTGVALMGAALAIVVAESTAEGHTYWQSLDIDPKTALVYLQLGMGIVVASVLALAAEIAQRETAAAALGRAEEEQRAAAERVALFDAERAARERAEVLERRASSLQAVTAELAAASRAHDVAHVVVTRLVPAIGGMGGSIFELSGGGATLRIIEHASYPDDMIDAFGEIRLDASLPPADAMREYAPVLLGGLDELRAAYPEISDPRLEDPAYGRAWAHLPLVAGGRGVGMLIVAFAEPQAFDAEQQSHLTLAADTVAQALQRARLFELEERARRRSELLERNASHLSAALSVRDVSESTITDLESAGITIAVLGILSGNLIETVGASGIPSDARRRFAQFPASEPSLLTDAIRAGRAIVVESADEYEARYPTFAPIRREVGMGAFLAVPLYGGESRPFGALAVSVPDSSALDADLRQLVTAIAEQTGLALKRALLFRSERLARERAELLERNASQLVDANSVQDVADATIADIALFEMELAIFGVVEGSAVRVAAATGIEEGIVRDYERFELSRRTVIAETVRTGSIVVASSGEELDRRFPDAVLLRERTRSESIVGAPLRAGDGRVLGVLVVTSREPDWIDDHRRQLIEGVATQAGVALERALLQEQAATAAANAQFLVELGDALEGETTVRGRAERLLELLVSQRAAHAVVQIDDLQGTIHLESGEQDESLRVATVPLRARGRTLGSLTVQPSREGAERLGGLQLRDIAERAAIAIDNAALYERERDVSHALQVGLLGEEPGKLGSALATAYLPGTAMLEVGGDWYDAFELPGDRVAFVVGDVVGHGLDAAMAMGQLRGAVRALAPIGGPVDLLRNLDVFVESVPQACMATIAYAELTPSTGRLRYGIAGHPPPIVAEAGGAARFLWDGRSSPLGSAVARDRVQAEGELGAGELLVLYTDGLIERRTSGLDVMLDRLLGAATRRSGEDAAQTLENILSLMLGGEAQADDVCVLAFQRVATGRFLRRLPAAPQEIADLRHALSNWLDERAVATEIGRDLVLAVSEAAANAAEHAYGFDGVGVVDVEVELDADSMLVASIADRGVWRVPQVSPDRGRGTTIMRALMEDVAVESTPQGTIVRMRLPTAEGVST